MIKLEAKVLKQKGEIEQYPDVDDWDWEDE